MQPAMPFRLGTGAGAPVQQSQVTCGSASLTVARMLVNPAFSRWIVDGIRVGQPRDRRPEAVRFGEYERVVMGRTNGLVAAGRRVNLPWPRRLGTPPWGARAELEHGASRCTSYCTRLVRFGPHARLREAYAELSELVRPGRPALLYVGNAWLPRHVTLLVPGERGALNVYDPATGTVSSLPEAPFAERRLRIAGWDVPWFSIHPAERAQS